MRRPTVVHAARRATTLACTLLSRAVVVLTCALLLLLVPSQARAHGLGENIAGTVWSGLIGALLLTSASIATHAYRLRFQRNGARRNAMFFAAGWLAMALALLSPIDYFGEALFSMHMVQHVLVMNVAVPLLLLARPERYFPAALPRIARAWSAARHRAAIVRVWRQLSSIEIGFVINALAIWVWHVPVAHNWALRSSTAHTLQHLTFAIAAIIFWAGIWRTIGRARAGLAILSLFGTAVHTGVLGAFLTLSTASWYNGYSPELFGLDRIADQQLAGLIMWIPGGVAYVGAALLLMANWLRFSDFRSPDDRARA